MLKKKAEAINKSKSRIFKKKKVDKPCGGH